MIVVSWKVVGKGSRIENIINREEQGKQILMMERERKEAVLRK